MAGTRIGLAMTTALVALVLGGCARDDTASEVDPGGSSAARAEGGRGSGNGGSRIDGDERPGPDTPVDEPTLSLPALPIGGNLYSSIDGNHPDNQCTNVNWIVDSDAADLVSGIEVEVTGVAFDPVAFTVASTGCDDDAPPCPGFVFTADARVCNLAVAPIPGSDTSGSFAVLAAGPCRLPADGERALPRLHRGGRRRADAVARAGPAGDGDEPRPGGGRGLDRRDHDDTTDDHDAPPTPTDDARAPTADPTASE